MARLSTSDVLARAGVRTVGELADASGVRDCLAWFRREHRWIDRKHLELCRIPAPTFQEDERAAWMADGFRELGCTVRVDRAGNVIASYQRTGDGPYVALTAHLDTVLAPRKPEDVSVNGQGRFQGPGVSDNGSGLAALLAIAGALEKHPLPAEAMRRLLFVANVGEEGEGNLSGMRFLCRPSELGGKISSFVVLDGPSTEHVTARAVASRRYEVTITGPGGHSWSDFGIGNPVHALSRAVSLFTENRVNGAGGPRTTFNVGLIDGGTSVNSIPDRAQAKVDLRSEDPANIEAMAAALTASVEQAIGSENGRGKGPRLAARVREIGARPGGQLAAESSLLGYVRAVDRYFGIRSQPDCASTDANVPLSLGWEAVSIGAGGQGGGAHTPEEWYDPEGRDLGLKRVLLVLALLLRAAEAAP